MVRVAELTLQMETCSRYLRLNNVCGYDFGRQTTIIASVLIYLTPQHWNLRMS